MKKRALMALLAVPLAMLLVVPPVSHANGGNTYTMDVECWSGSSQFAFADLTFLGHYIHVLCPAHSGEHTATFSFSSTASGLFVAKLLGGTHYQTNYGTFTPGDCYNADGVFGPGDGSYAVWEIESTYSCG